MAHWAEIKDDKVVRVTVGDDNSEGEWLVGNLGGVWVQTSYNTTGGVHYTDGEPSTDQAQSLRFNYAGIGYTYDEARDAFIPAKPYASWVLDEATRQWVAPTPKPDGEYVWDEQAGDWVEA
jgi:hypothetical protein